MPFGAALGAAAELTFVGRNCGAEEEGVFAFATDSLER